MRDRTLLRAGIKLAMAAITASGLAKLIAYDPGQPRAGPGHAAVPAATSAAGGHACGAGSRGVGAGRASRAACCRRQTVSDLIPDCHGRDEVRAGRCSGRDANAVATARNTGLSASGAPSFGGPASSLSAPGGVIPSSRSCSPAVNAAERPQADHPSSGTLDRNEHRAHGHAGDGNRSIKTEEPQHLRTSVGSTRGGRSGRPRPGGWGSRSPGGREVRAIVVRGCHRLTWRIRATRSGRLAQEYFGADLAWS
jgi:hypothetical protein